MGLFPLQPTVKNDGHQKGVCREFMCGPPHLSLDLLLQISEANVSSALTTDKYHVRLSPGELALQIRWLRVQGDQVKLLMERGNGDQMN